MRSPKSSYILAVLLLVLSCSTPKADDRNEINIRLFIAMDKATPVLLKLDGKKYFEEDAKPHRGVSRSVQAFADEGGSINVHYRVGQRDTSFVYKVNNHKNYLSIIYSRWWDKFMIRPLDSLSFYTGGHNNIIEYD